MPRKHFQRLLPHPNSIINNRQFAFLGHRIRDTSLWHLSCRSVAGAFFIGVFCAFLPIPFQTVLAALLAVIFKRNLPLAVILVFITNPLTMAPIFYFNFWVGSFFIDAAVNYNPLDVERFGQPFLTQLNLIGKPLFVGSIINGLLFGLLSYWSIRLFWLMVVMSKWQQRSETRRARRAKKRQQQ